MSSNNYIRDGLRADKEQVTAVYDLVDEVLHVFPRFFDNDQWPYSVSANGSSIEEVFSFSTDAMIMFSLATSADLLRESILIPTHMDRRNINTSHQRQGERDLTSILEVGFSRFIQESKEHWPKDTLVTSGTFGKNDPFTLTWIAATCRAIRPSLPDEEDFRNRLKDTIAERLKVIRERQIWDRRDYGGLILSLEYDPPKGLNKAVTHVFPLLRLAHLALENARLEAAESQNDDSSYDSFGVPYNLSGMDPETARPLQHIFRDNVHLQLSYHHIPDSDFDVGELVFALEGLLLTDEDVESSLVTAVFDAVESRQEYNPHWRPLRPFIVSDRGFALLPLSVEVANSLLRCCLLLDKKDRNTSYFSEYVDIFRRYEQWVRAHAVRGKVKEVAAASGEKPFIGWHSEHVLTAGTIHLWQTSQMLLFFILYAELLQRYLASTALEAAGLRALRQASRQSNQSEPAVETNKNETQEEEGDAKTASRGSRAEDDSSSKISVYDIEERMRQDFVRPWSNYEGRDRRNSSMLFYGPPGTGKTTLARRLATMLDWPMLTVTPSDFIREGPGAVEARAKDIFDALQEQSKVVILFDEIDHLILDRDSKFYEQQEDVFQFMTPSMLTKFQDLHDVQRSIFIISTNYADHIDAAIKRRGRIDQHYLVLAPDWDARLDEFRIAIKRVFKRDVGTLNVQSELDQLVKRISLATFRELKQLIDRELEGEAAARSDDPKAIDETEIKEILRECAQDFEPSLNVGSYENRFHVTNSELKSAQEPFDEVLLLFGLYCDKQGYIQEALDDKDRQLLKEIFASYHGNLVDDLLPRSQSELRKRIRTGIGKLA